jgi:hypothetical protein
MLSIKTDIDSAVRGRSDAIKKQMQSVSITFKLQWMKNFLAEGSTEPEPTCYICKATFTRLMTLEGHLKAHAGLKQYQCESCGKAFARKRDLAEHERIHRGTKRYVCKRIADGHSYGCGQRFLRNTTLNRHWKSQKGKLCLATRMPAHTVSESEEELNDSSLINDSLEAGDKRSLTRVGDDQIDFQANATSNPSSWLKTNLLLHSMADELVIKLGASGRSLLQPMLQSLPDNARREFSNVFEREETESSDISQSEETEVTDILKRKDIEFSDNEETALDQAQELKERIMNDWLEAVTRIPSILKERETTEHIFVHGATRILVRQFIQNLEMSLER